MISFTDPLNACTGTCLVASFHGYALRSPGSHEVGHTLGLGHSTVAGATLYRGPVGRHLTSTAASDLN